MIKKIAILALLIFFTAGAVTADTADKPAHKGSSVLQSAYSWFGSWDKDHKTKKPVSENKEQNAAKPAPKGSPAAQSLYSWFGSWDKDHKANKPVSGNTEQNAVKSTPKGKPALQPMYNWLDGWDDLCVNKGDRHCFGTWDSDGGKK